MKHAIPLAVGMLTATLGCRGGITTTLVKPVETDTPASADSAVPLLHAGTTSLFEPGQPEFPPRAAYLAGLLPLGSIGVTDFLARYPRYDGRGVILGILDTGLDADLPGFRTTTTGAPKILDLRDFSGEGIVELEAAVVDGDEIRLSDVAVSGASRLLSRVTGPVFAGMFRELQLGTLPAADANGDGDNDDAFLVAVARGTDGWLMMTDTDGDGTLADENPVRDYGVAAQTFTYTVPGVGTGPLTIVANIGGDEIPELAFFFDNQGHGSHVSGIAAGHDMFGVPGFDGVAPGAQILGLKISNNSRGAVTVTGSVLRAMNYAADYAERRGMPLVLNLSFGVGNVREGVAAIDSIVNQFALKHPNVLFVSSSGNDGPGISTLSVPASADLALSVCALYPAAFSQAAAFDTHPKDVLAWWSARGAETGKPDLCAPGLAFSNVPRWKAGEEISPGTSMASPQIAGAAALLNSAMLGDRRAVRAIDIKTGLMATAVPVPNGTVLDQGRGVPNVTEAFWWLRAGHPAGVYLTRVVDETGVTEVPAAYRRNGVALGDTLQQFVVSSLTGQPAARMLLSSDAPWLSAPGAIEFAGRPVTVTVAYHADQLQEPGLYVGTVWARSASDTTAGALFGLQNTIVVPYRLESELTFEGETMLGSFDRYFVDVPPEANGLSLDFELGDWSRSATVHVFEPSGQPYRGGAILEPPEGHVRARLNIPANNLVEGVYEVVVTTSEALPVDYFLVMTAPPLYAVFGRDSASIVVKNQGISPREAHIEATILGSRIEGTVVGAESTISALEMVIPRWTTRLGLELSLADKFWSSLSDLGVAILSADGHVLFAESINYAMQQVTIPVQHSWTGRRVRIELTPGYSHIGVATDWSADVSISMLLAEPVPLAVRGLGVGGKILLESGNPMSLWFDATESPVAQGEPVLVEVLVAPLTDVPTVVRGVVHLPVAAEKMEDGQQ